MSNKNNTNNGLNEIHVVTREVEKSIKREQKQIDKIKQQEKK